MNKTEIEAQEEEKQKGNAYLLLYKVLHILKDLREGKEQRIDEIEQDVIIKRHMVINRNKEAFAKFNESKENE